MLNTGLQRIWISVSVEAETVAGQDEPETSRATT